MNFPAPTFLFIFLPISIIVYYCLPRPARNLFLFLISLLFYAWGEPKRFIILLLLIVYTYIAGRLLGRLVSKNSPSSGLFLFSSIVLVLLILIHFKYLIFIAGLIHFPVPNTILLLGLSFITFHIISYLIDIYRGTIKAEKNFINLSLYLTFFPHLIAGPIVRYVDIGPQLVKRRESREKFMYGITRFIIGLGKKVIIANTLALVVDKIYSFEFAPTRGELWLALFAFALQIYYDFSGYSDMAIGLARMFGITFAENFNYPYVSRSIREFWRRWHMTLSSWFRDYLYIPLGGSRHGKLRAVLAILIVFTLTGMWHGANWNFIIWGLYYGIFLSLETLFLQKFLQRLWDPIQHLYALTVVVFGWLLFRLSSLVVVWYVFKAMMGLMQLPLAPLKISFYLTGKVIFILIIACVGTIPWKSKIHISLLVLIFTYALMHVAAESYSPFIYFRF